MVLPLLLGPGLLYCVRKTVLPLEGLVHLYKELFKGTSTPNRPFNHGLYLQSAFGMFVSCCIELVKSYRKVD